MNIADQEKLNMIATPEIPNTHPTTQEQIAKPFETIVEESFIQLDEFGKNNEQTTATFLQKAEHAVKEYESNPKTLKDFSVSIQRKDMQEKQVIAEGIAAIEAIKNIDPNTFSKKYHHPNYRAEMAKVIREERKSGGTGADTLSAFHEKTFAEKENFESQEKERSVAEIMKEKDMVIVHAIPLDSWSGSRGSDFNNPMVKNNQDLSFRDSVELIIGMSPSISTSIPSPDRINSGLYKKTGVILGEGKVLSALPEDSGSVAHDLYKRIPKYTDEDNRHTAVQKSIDIDNIVVGSGNFRNRSNAWNELVVEQPQIAGLFVDLSVGISAAEEKSNQQEKERESQMIFDNETKEFRKTTQEEKDAIDKKWQKRQDERQVEAVALNRRENQKNLKSLRKYSKEMNLPIYAFKNENGELKKYEVEFMNKYPDNYLEEVLIPKEKEILLRVNNNKNDSEYQLFYNNEYLPAKEMINNMVEGKQYLLHPVTAKDIYESKRKISDDEKHKVLEDIKAKGILSNAAEIDVNKKLSNL